MAVNVIGLAYQRDDALRQRGCLGGIPDGPLHDDEFIPAHPCDRVGVAHQPAQPPRDDLQELVAGEMAKGIVHGLELIEIKVVHRHYFLAVNPVAQRLFEPLVQQHPIGEIGERVVVGHIFDLDLGLPLLGDVFMGGNPAAVGHRPVANLEGAPVSQFDDTVGGFGRYGNLGAPVEVFLFGHRGKASRFETHVDDFGQRDTGTDAVARKIIHLDIAVVAYDQAMRWIEET